MVNPNSYRALLFDVDKTLTNSSRECTPETIRALQKIREQRKRIGVCTGRHYTTLHQEVLPIFQPSDYHVVSGGAQVIQTDGKIIWEKCIPYTVVLDLIDALNSYSTRIYVQEGKNIYGNQKAIDEWKIVIGDKHSLVIHPFSKLPKVDFPIVVVHEINADIFKTIISRSDINAKYMQNHTGKFYADITAAGVSKKSGVEQWCKLQGVKASEVIGFGDSENDVEFLQTVGWGVAMGNATDEVKNIANEVTLSCDANGVAVWINANL